MANPLLPKNPLLALAKKALTPRIKRLGWKSAERPSIHDWLDRPVPRGPFKGRIRRQVILAVGTALVALLHKRT